MIYEIPPGHTRTIYIYFKSGKMRNFPVQFRGIYWPADNKDLFKPIELDTLFIVEEPSPDQYNHEPTNPQQLYDILNINKKSYGFDLVSSLLAIMIIEKIYVISNP